MNEPALNEIGTQAVHRVLGTPITEWLASGREPDVGDVWFALPFLYEADPVTEWTG